jgi:hypothetical protein
VHRALRGIQRHLDVEEVVQIELRQAELEHPQLLSLQVEQIVEQRRQSRALGADDPEIATPVLRRDIALQHQIGEAENARQRRPQLMGDIADEIRLQPLALDQPLISFLELGSLAGERIRHRVEGPLELTDFAGALDRDAW